MISGLQEEEHSIGSTDEDSGYATSGSEQDEISIRRNRRRLDFIVSTVDSEDENSAAPAPRRSPRQHARSRDPPELDESSTETSEDDLSDAPNKQNWWCDTDSEQQDKIPSSVFSDSSGSDSESEIEVSFVSHRTRSRTPPKRCQDESEEESSTNSEDYETAEEPDDAAILSQESDDDPNSQNSEDTKEENKPKGDTMQHPKPIGISRFMTQNVNGMNLGLTGTAETKLKVMKEFQVDHAMFTEPNLATDQPKTRAAVHKQCQKVFGANQCRTVMASTPLEHQTQYKRGGILTTTTGNMRGREISSGSDKYGRWSWTTFAARAGHSVTWITTYQVCKTNPKDTNAKAGTVVKQIHSMYLAEGRHQPDKLRKHHSQDLVKFVKARQALGELVNVAGDFNETLGDTDNGLTKLCSECGLVDIVMATHGEQNFKTYIRGKKVLDYILMDPELTGSVTACGYLPFHEGIVSDHRAVFIDVNTKEFFGSQTPPLPRMENRGYNSKKMHQLVPYFNKMSDHLERNGWDAKVSKLLDHIEAGTRDDSLAEEIDTRRTQAALLSEKKLKPFPSTPYSPALARMRSMDCIISIKLSELRTGVDHSVQLNKRLNALPGEKFIVPEHEEECKILQAAHRHLWRAMVKEEVKTSRERRKHQDSLIGDYIEGGDKERAKIVARIQRAEEMKLVFKKLAHVRGKDKSSGLSHIEVPTDPTADPKTTEDWTRIDDPTEIYDYIKARNIKHFGQADQCTWTSPPLDVSDKFEGTCDLAEQILEGTLDTSEMNLDQATQWVIDKFKRVAEPNIIDHVLTEEEFRGKIESWKESTSTSPGSKVHLGHGKAYFVKHRLDPKSPEAVILESQRSRIVRGHLACLNYALQYGYTYKRWEIIVNAMIEKDPGDPKISRLRVIHLLEFDLNLIFCVKWRNLLHHSCDQKLLNRSAYGGRPGHNAIDPVFIKEMTYELCRLTRKHMVNFDNDATSCYDRILCFLANLASQKYGLSDKVCVVQGRSLREAKYHLKTKLGVSEQYVKHCRLVPWYGTGQGTGNSPVYWLLISSTLFDIYSERAVGATFASPDGATSLALCILGFVDDTNNYNNTFNRDIQPDLEELVAQASTDNQLWHDLLAAVNQELELPKCKYHLIHFDFSEQGAPIIVEDSIPPVTLQILDKHGAPKDIKHVPSSKAIKTLGHHKTIANQTKQSKVIKGQCDDYARVTRCGGMTRRDTRTFYHGIYLLSVGYTLPCAYFNFKQLDQMQRQSHSAIVSHCGYCSKTSRAVIFGPHILGGANFTHLFDVQTYGQVTQFLKFWRSPNTQGGGALRIVMAWAQYCVGTSVPILSRPDLKYPHFESKWISSLMAGLKAVEGTIEIDDPSIPKPQRENDISLMDIINHPDNPPNFIRRANYCRMYLGAWFISCISTPSGLGIDKDMYWGRKSSTSSRNKHLQVNQKCPDKKSWQIWRQLLNRRARLAPRNLRWNQPLGAWLVPKNELIREWPFWHDATSDILYHVDGDTISAHTRLRTDFDKDTDHNLAEIPDTAIPADTASHQHTWSVMPFATQWVQPMLPDPPADFAEHILCLPLWEQQLLQHILIFNPDTFHHVITTHRLIICSDGSAKADIAKGSFGWILSTDDGERLLTNYGPSCGSKPASYRSEGTGLLSALRFLHQFQTYHQVTLEVRLICDNESMVKKCNSIPDLVDIYPASTLASDWDILAELWNTLVLFPENTRPTTTHVKSHQDKKTKYEDLPLSAQLNVDADALAEQYEVDHPDTNCNRVLLLPTSGVQLHLSGQTVTYNLKARLKTARTYNLLRDKQCSRFGWSIATHESIHHEAARRALNNKKKHASTLIKLLHGILPLGARLHHKYDPKYPHKCPSCDFPDETYLHMIQCPDRQTWRDTFLQALRKQMSDNNTPLEVIQLMLDGVQSVLDGQPPSSIAAPAHLQHILDAQTTIGWEHLLRGRLSILWSTHQQNHLSGPFDPLNNGATWTTDIILIVFTHFLIVWNKRNKERHGSDHASRQDAKRKQCIREVELLYSKMDGLPPTLAWILELPIETRLESSGPVLRAWISSYKPIIEENYSDEAFTVD